MEKLLTWDGPTQSTEQTAGGLNGDGRCHNLKQSSLTSKHTQKKPPLVLNRQRERQTGKLTALKQTANTQTDETEGQTDKWKSRQGKY